MHKPHFSEDELFDDEDSDESEDVHEEEDEEQTTTMQDGDERDYDDALKRIENERD